MDGVIRHKLLQSRRLWRSAMRGGLVFVSPLKLTTYGGKWSPSLTVEVGRRTSEPRVCSPEMVLPGKPRGAPTLKAAGGVTVSGRGGASRGGVDDRGALEEDGPVTWEAPVCPRAMRGSRRPRPQTPPARRASADARAAGSEQAFAPW